MVVTSLIITQPFILIPWKAADNLEILFQCSTIQTPGVQWCSYSDIGHGTISLRIIIHWSPHCVASGHWTCWHILDWVILVLPQLYPVAGPRWSSLVSRANYRFGNKMFRFDTTSYVIITDSHLQDIQIGPDFRWTSNWWIGQVSSKTDSARRKLLHSLIGKDFKYQIRKRN